MKDKINSIGASTLFVLGMIVYFTVTVLIYNDIPRCHINIVKSVPESINRPLIIYSRKNYCEIIRNCTCWFKCVCLLSYSNKLVESETANTAFIDIIIHDPLDIRVITEYRIKESPYILLNQSKKPNSIFSLSYSLSDYLEVSQYILVDILFVVLQTCILKRTDALKYSDYFWCFLLILLYSCIVIRRSFHPMKKLLSSTAKKTKELEIEGEY